MEIVFPLEFVVQGTPVSQNPRRRKHFHEWQQRIRDSCQTALPSPHFATEARVSVVLYYLPLDEMQGDLDNIIKPILDAMRRFVFVDDHQVDRLLVQKFEPERTPELVSGISPALLDAWNSERPLLYVRISDKLDEEVV